MHCRYCSRDLPKCEFPTTTHKARNWCRECYDLAYHDFKSGSLYYDTKKDLRVNWTPDPVPDTKPLKVKKKFHIQQNHWLLFVKPDNYSEIHYIIKEMAYSSKSFENKKAITTISSSYRLCVDKYFEYLLEFASNQSLSERIRVALFWCNHLKKLNPELYDEGYHHGNECPEEIVHGSPNFYVLNEPQYIGQENLIIQKMKKEVE